MALILGGQTTPCPYGSRCRCRGRTRKHVVARPVVLAGWRAPVPCSRRRVGHDPSGQHRRCRTGSRLTAVRGRTQSRRCSCPVVLPGWSRSRTRVERPRHGTDRGGATTRCPCRFQLQRQRLVTQAVVEGSPSSCRVEKTADPCRRRPRNGTDPGGADERGPVQFSA